MFNNKLLIKKLSLLFLCASIATTSSSVPYSMPTVPKTIAGICGALSIYYWVYFGKYWMEQSPIKKSDAMIKRIKLTNLPLNRFLDNVPAIVATIVRGNTQYEKELTEKINNYNKAKKEHDDNALFYGASRISKQNFNESFSNLEQQKTALWTTLDLFGPNAENTERSGLYRKKNNALKRGILTAIAAAVLLVKKH